MKKYDVFIPSNHPNPPELHEISAAELLSAHFQCTVEFLVPTNQYKTPNADFKMLGVMWELKSPKSSAKNVISNQLRLAYKQSKNIIIDMRRSNMNTNRAKNLMKHELSNRKAISRAIMITHEKIVEVFR